MKIEKALGRIVGNIRFCFRDKSVLYFHLSAEELSLYKRIVATDNYCDLLWIKNTHTGKKIVVNKWWRKK
jgi:hypothetical protein